MRNDLLTCPQAWRAEPSLAANSGVPARHCCITAAWSPQPELRATEARRRARLDLIILILLDLEMSTLNSFLCILYTGVRMGNTCISRLYDCTILIENKYK